MKKIHFIIIISFFIYSCTSHADRVDNEVVEVNVDTDLLTPFTSELFSEDINIISLETTDESLISHVSKLISNNGKLYVCDRHSDKVYIFDDKGTFIKQVGQQGRGPGEYLKLGSIALDLESGSLLVTSNAPNKLMRYDLNGSFKDEIDTKISATDITVKDRTIFWYANSTANLDGGQYQLYSTDMNGNIINEYFPFDEYNRYPYSMSFATSNSFYEYDDHVMFFMPLVDAVYECGKDSVDCRYKFDFGKNALPPEYVNMNRTNLDFPYEIMKSDYARDLQSVFENSDYLFFTFDLQHNGYKNLVYDKKLGKIFSTYEAFDSFITNILHVSDEKLLATITAVEFMRECKSALEQKKQLSSNVEYAYKSIKEDDNPVLLIYAF